SIVTARAPVAIIGMAGRFARSPDLDTLWTHLANSVDLVQQVDRWDFDAMRPDAVRPRGSLIEGIAEFDPLFFNISGLEACYMDPKQRLFLQECWHALEDAGYAGAAVQGRPVGVYVGNEQGDYERLIQDEAPGQAVWGTAGSM